MRTFNYFIISILFPFACFAQNQNTNITNDEKPIILEQLAPDGLIINICRPEKYFKLGTNPDFFIDDKVVSEIKAGSSISYKLELGKAFKLASKSNMLMFRFKEEVILQGASKNGGELFFMLEGKHNLLGGLSIVLGGAIVAAVQQNYETKESPNWTIANVTESAYKEKCTLN